MTKLDYKTAKNKKAVRDFLFSKIKFEKIVGLPGPNLNDYIRWCKSKGCKEFELWEYEPTILRKQLSVLQPDPCVSFKFGDILNADADRKKTLYDLDYCVTVRYMAKHLKKFHNKFIMTFSRRIKDDETISTFFKQRLEEIKSIVHHQSPVKHTVYQTTNGSVYIYAPYRDTSNMCCFAKIK